MEKNKDETVKTMFTISMSFLIIFFLTSWDWSIWVSLIVGLIGLFSPSISIKIEYIWFKFSFILSLIIPNILLSSVYYLLLFPLSIFYRIFSKKDPLMLKNLGNSTYDKREKKFEKESFEKTW